MSSIAPCVWELRMAMKGNDEDAIDGITIAVNNKRGQVMKSEFMTNRNNVLKSDMAKYAEKLKVFDDFGTMFQFSTQVTDSDEEYNLGSKFKQEKYIDGKDYNDDKKCKEDRKSDLIGNEEKYPVQVKDPGFDDSDCDDDDVKKCRKNLIDMVEGSATGAERSAVRRLIELVTNASAKFILIFLNFPEVAAAKSLGGSQDLANLLNTTISAARICFSSLPYNVSGIAHLPGCRFPFPPQNSTVCNGLSVRFEDNCLNLFGNTSTISSLYKILVKEGRGDHPYEVDALINSCILDNETLTSGYAGLMFDMNLPNNTCTVWKTVEETVTSASNTSGGGIDYGMVFGIGLATIVIVGLIVFLVLHYKKKWCLKKCLKKPSDASTATIRYCAVRSALKF